VPIYELDGTSLKPFHRLNPVEQLYESEIEELVWGDLEAFTGEPLFPVARQPRISGGGIPDVVALDRTGRVVVIEVKRDADRGQLAQCLEYAGWARQTSLDEVASLYRADGLHFGPEAFFADWQEFTDSATPTTIDPRPRLVLIARDFQGRTRSALDFLQENSLPVVVVPVTMYEDPETKRRVVNIDAEHEPGASSTSWATAGGVPLGTGSTTSASYLLDGRRVMVSDLIDARLIEAGERTKWHRPRKDMTYWATVQEDGSFRLDDGRVFQSPSMAARSAAGMVSYDGWYAWTIPRLGDARLVDLRQQLIDAATKAQLETPAPEVFSRPVEGSSVAVDSSEDE
jgi:hypothetical protein